MKAVRRATRLCESLSPSHGENMFQVFLLSYQNLYLGSLFLVLEALSAHVLIVSAACNHYNYISVPSEDVFVSFIVHAKEIHKETKNFMCDVQSDLRLKLSALHKDMYERKHRTNARERRIRIKNHAASFVETAII